MKRTASASKPLSPLPDGCSHYRKGLPATPQSVLPACSRALFLLALAIVTILPQASAQVAVQLKLNKSSYILNEAVTATVYITNHAGRQLTLRSENGRPWLHFHITGRGRVVPVARRIDYGAVVVPTGQTVARTVSLNMAYALGNIGNYICQAQVNMPGPTRNGFTSNRAQFSVAKGRAVWSQRIGIPDAPGEIRQYELLSFSGNQAVELFANVSSTNRGYDIATIPLGRILTFRKPTGTLDGANNLHAIYQIKPNIFAHSCVTPSGKLKFTTYHKRGASGDPRLMTFANGEVRVAGGVLHDPKAEAENRKKIRNISERPPFVYQ